MTRKRTIRVLSQIVYFIMMNFVSILVFTIPSKAAMDMNRATIGGDVRARYEFRNNADFANAVPDTLSFIGLRSRLHLGYEVNPDLSVYLQMRDSRLFGSEASVTSNEENLDLHQGYLKVVGLGPFTMILGRQEMIFGDSRLIGNFGWSNVGRSFDAVRLTSAYGPLRSDVWAAVTKLFGTNIAPDPALSPSNRDTQQFFGVYTIVNSASFSLEPYLLYLRDTGNASELVVPSDPSKGLLSPITSPLARGQDRITLGFRGAGRMAEEMIDFSGEFAYQVGQMDARGSTPRSDIHAYALAVKAGYTVPTEMKPRIGIEYDRASGDDNAADDEFKTFENLFPTNHSQYGYMDYVGWRNMQGLRISFGLQPTKTSGVNINYHFFWLAEKADNWYRASGAIFRTTPSGNTEADLGQELDLVGHMIVKERLRVEAGYGHFFPGDYVKTNFPAATNHSDFVYVQTALGF
jgi:hypothetical protein